MRKKAKRSFLKFELLCTQIFRAIREALKEMRIQRLQKGEVKKRKRRERQGNRGEDDRIFLWKNGKA